MHFRSLAFTSTLAITLALPIAAFAMQSQTLEFAQGQLNAKWEGLGAIQMRQVPSGILLSSTGTGKFVTPTALGVFPQTGVLITSAERDTTVYFTWTFTDDPAEIEYAVRIDLSAGSATATPFSLADNPYWKKGGKTVGLVLPPGSTLLLHSIELQQLNVAEKTVEAVRSFWTFDSYRPYSINFVWGPEIVTNPIARANLFQNLPPKALSGTYVLNGILVAGLLIIALVLYYKSGGNKKRRLIHASCILVLAVWILLDLRMGSEFLSWVKADHDAYISAPAGRKTFRERDRFYDFAEFARPYLQDRQSYIFLAQQQWPYLGNLRYLTYPAIPGISIETDDTWVIYDRPDMDIDAAGQITLDGEAVSTQGTLLGRFDAHSFIFRTDEPDAEPSQPQS